MQRHSADLVSLVAGLVFTALGAVVLLGELYGMTVEARWVVPLVLLGLGVCGLAATLRPSRDSRTARSTEGSEPAAEESTPS